MVPPLGSFASLLNLKSATSRQITTRNISTGIANRGYHGSNFSNLMIDVISIFTFHQSITPVYFHETLTVSREAVLSVRSQ